jgi:plasmid stabilization system protein ParE
VAEPRIQVELTASFFERLESIEDYLTEADASQASQAYDKLLDGLRRTVIPNLRRFPRLGRRYLDQPPQSAEAMAQLAALPSGAADALREYLHGDYLILYTFTGSTVHLLSIRHHRQLSFAFAKLWEP